MILLFEFSAWLAAKFPLKLRVAFARLVGLLFFLLSRRIRRNTIANMAVVLARSEQDPAARALARESVMQYAEHIVDLLAFQRASPERIMARFNHIEHWDNVTAALSAGRGAIFASAHFGNWEVGGARMASQYPLTVIQETFANRSANELLRRVRSAKNMQVVQLGSAAGSIMRALRKNGVVGLLVDRPTPGEGVAVEFFGRSTAVPTGTARLSIRARCPVLVGGVVRNPDHTYFGVIAPPIFPNEEGDPDAETARITQLMMNQIEDMIRRSPHQWYMFRRMWPRATVARNGTGRPVGMAV